VTTLKPLLARNRSWALQKCQHDPDYFEKWVDGQRPHSLWIGCSDSRVPAEVLTGSQPGELFVHRNIANMLDPADDNVMSVLQYALHYLEVERVVLCGHYGCGGVQAALSCPPCRWRRSPRRWLAASASCATPCITKLRRSPMTVVLRPPRRASASADAERSRHALDALVEANVRAQFARLLESEPVQTVLASGRPLSLHGCVYDLASGHLTTLVEHLSPQEHAP
jgi:carbonic anhydrase